MFVNLFNLFLNFIVTFYKKRRKKHWNKIKIVVRRKCELIFSQRLCPQLSLIEYDIRIFMKNVLIFKKKQLFIEDILKIHVKMSYLFVENVNLFIHRYLAHSEYEIRTLINIFYFLIFSIK